MKVKKLFLAAFIVLMLASSVCASEHKVGFLGLLNTTDKEESRTISSIIADTKDDPVFFTPAEVYAIKPAVYDSLQSMQMALNAGEVDEIMLPEAVTEYLMKVNTDYTVAAIIRGYLECISPCHWVFARVMTRNC